MSLQMDTADADDSYALMRDYKASSRLVNNSPTSSPYDELTMASKITWSASLMEDGIGLLDTSKHTGASTTSHC